MKVMKKVTALVLCGTLLGMPLPRVGADDTDIFGANIQPNVMLLIDTSTSMEKQIATYPYDPNTTYAQDPKCTYTSTVVYQKAKKKSCNTVYANSINDVPDASARAALSTDGFWSGKIGGSKVSLYMGNYLNYQACASCTVQEKKIDIAKRVFSNLVRNVDGVRFGVMRLRGSPDSGEVVATIGTDKTTIINSINSLAPESGTPIGEQLYDAGQYFKGLTLINGTKFASPIQYECQPNFVILMTDGKQNGSMDVRTEATNRYIQDHATGLPGLQNVIVHTVGFAIDDPDEKLAANDILREAATNGGGSFYYANNAAELEAALQDAIRQIVAATFAFATPVIPTTSATGSTRAYVASFKSDPSRPFWRGYLKAYQRGADGLVPVDGNGVPLDSAMVWEVGQKLSQKAASIRMIYTVVAGSREEFRTSTSAITPALLGVSTTTDRDKLMDFIRGVDTFDEDLDGNVTEERAWKLGDIFHSTPVLVTPPFAPSADSSYLAFKSANANRTTVLLVGANDGMLHAFRESDGEELWAFIPPDLLGGLNNLTLRSGQHLFYADSSPIVVDVKMGTNWKTIVLFGERRGGKSYHALDITDTTNPAFLWSFTDSKIEETWSEPVIGKVKMADGTEKFVAFVGGGYDSDQNNVAGKAFFVIDVATGQKLWEFYNNNSSDDRKHMNFSLAANPTAADLDMDEYVDRVYIGDVGGQLWKFDVSAPATLSGGLITNWAGMRLFAAAPSQPNPPPAGEYYPAQAIYAPAVPAFDTTGNLWIYFGTGDRNHPNNSSTNRFYGIKDNIAMGKDSALTEANLVDVTSTDANATQGWFFRLGSSEKVLSAADVFNKVVFFSSFIPTTAVACGTGEGTAKLYAIQMLTGYAAVDYADPAQPLLASSGSAKTRYKVIGTGIPSRPVIVITDSGTTVTASVIAATTSQQLPSNPAPPPSSMRRILYWREAF
jgi:type IV pilus assembly protein PilY1